jgi:hypothetical protein
VVAIAPNGEGGFVGRTVATSYANGVRQDFFTSRMFGEAFYFGKTGLFDFHASRWLRVEADGFGELNGASPGVPPSPEDAYKLALVHDLPTLHRMLFQGRDGFFLYDGALVTPVPGGGRDIVGRWPRIFDLPSIGRVLVHSEKGSFELTQDGRLERIVAPSDTEGFHGVGFLDWPNAGIALASTKRGVYGVSRDLRFSKLAFPGGSDQASFHYVSSPNPRTGDILISSTDGSFLAVVNTLGSKEGCSDQR